MSVGKINNVNVITHTRTVGSIVIVSENREALKLTAGNLGNIRKKIVRNSLRIFADQAALMRTDRIEITQYGYAPLRIGNADICENTLDNQFRFSVRVCSGKREILTDRHTFGLAVYGCRRAEHNQLDIVLCHNLAKYQCSGKIVVIISYRLSNRFTDSLETRKVNDRVNIVLVKYTVDGFVIKKVGIIKLRMLSGNSLNSVDNTFLTVGKVIENNYITTVVK